MVGGSWEKGQVRGEGKRDMDTLEQIQKRATKMIPELRDLNYEECLKECGLTTL